MSKFKVYYSVHEVQVDEQDDVVKEFQGIVPHAKFIGEEMCKSWNEMHMEQYYDGILKDNIEKAYMTFLPRTPERVSYAVVNVVGKPGFRFSANRRSEIVDQTEAQFSDGWGEGFFGPVNILQAPDGVRLYVE